MPDPSAVTSALRDAWTLQIGWCDRGGSPFTARVLEAAWSDWLAGGALRELMPDWPRDPVQDAVALRVAGALHSLVLDGSDPVLAANYPPRTDTFDPVAGSAAVRNALDAHRARVALYLQRPPQTNEVGRSAVLLGGFAEIAARTGLPLALREVGASAGLNLLWFRFRYELGALQWGDRASPVTIRAQWHGAPRALAPAIDVASFSGCDAAPIDLAAPHAALRLASYVWPDQRERLQRLQAAIELALAEGIRVEQTDAAAFVERELATVRAGATTVIYHSIVWSYLTAQTRESIRASIERAGAAATETAPVAWLSFEQVDPQARPHLTLTLWPGGERVKLAEAHPHGTFVIWGDAPP
jgi:hypothetical protein